MSLARSVAIPVAKSVARSVAVGESGGGGEPNPSVGIGEAVIGDTFVVAEGYADQYFTTGYTEPGYVA